MKKDLDLIRSVLLFIEENGNLHEPLTLAQLSILSNGNDLLIYQIELLMDANFIEATCLYGDDGIADFLIYRMKNDGHDYLDTIRNPAIWNKTKEGLSIIGESASLVIVKKIAEAAITALLKTNGFL